MNFLLSAWKKKKKKWTKNKNIRTRVIIVRQTSVFEFWKSDTKFHGSRHKNENRACSTDTSRIIVFWIVFRPVFAVSRLQENSAREKTNKTKNLTSVNTLTRLERAVPYCVCRVFEIRIIIVIITAYREFILFICPSCVPRDIYTELL